MTPSSQPNFTDRAEEARVALNALAGVVARYTVALILKNEGSLGSGVLVTAGGALFVATARHVATDLPPGDIYCIPKSPGSIEIIPREEVLRRAARGEVKPSERFLFTPRTEFCRQSTPTSRCCGSANGHPSSTIWSSTRSTARAPIRSHITT